MATRFTFPPEAAQFPGTNYPQLLRDGQSRLALAFDAVLDETCVWTAVAPQGLVLPLTVVVHFYAASATSGAVHFQAQIEAVTPGGVSADDTVNLSAAASFAAASSGSANVPATQGYLGSVVIAIANPDSIAAGDYFRLALNRDADNVSDTAAGDIRVLAVELRDAA